LENTTKPDTPGHTNWTATETSGKQPSKEATELTGARAAPDIQRKEASKVNAALKLTTDL
jgi:hypothetical protein